MPAPVLRRLPPTLLLLFTAALGRDQADPVRQGAHVRVVAPVFGTEVRTGRFAKARVGGRFCHGVALDQPDARGNPLFVLLKGITHLDVDQRTNHDYVVLDLTEPADSDWVAIPLDALAAADSACRQAPPAP